MNYNKNIILDILRSNFFEEIETFVTNYVLDLEENDLIMFFETSVDYAMLDYIEEISVVYYEVEKEEGQDNISGMINVIAEIDGYLHWDGEENFVGSNEIEIGIDFSFYEENNDFFDIELEDVY